MMFVMAVCMSFAVVSGMIVLIFLPFHMMMVANSCLFTVVPFVFTILFPIDVTVKIRPRFIYYYFVTSIHVKVFIAVWQSGRKNPPAPFHVNKMLAGNIIENVDVRHVVIIDVLVTYGSPLRLCINVNIETDMHLSMRILRKKDTRNERNKKHTFLHGLNFYGFIF